MDLKTGEEQEEEKLMMEKAKINDLDFYMQGFRENIKHDRTFHAISDTISRSQIDEFAYNRHALSCVHDHYFNVKIDDWAASNQKSSGRCWIFSGVTLLRYFARSKMNVDNVFLSQSYVFFWDKMERANYLLDTIIKTANETAESRVIQYLMEHAGDDGGQWDMFVSVVKKYGIVPRSFYPESYSSNNSHKFVTLLKNKLREFALQLRIMVQNGESSQKIQSRKRAQLHFLFRFLCLHLGTPPTQFTFSFYDKKAKKTQCLVDYTPQRFFEEYINSAMIECNHRAAVVEVEESESEEEEEDFIKIERNQKVKEKEKNEVKLLEGKEKEINQQELKKQQQEKDPLGIIQEVTSELSPIKQQNSDSQSHKYIHFTQHLNGHGLQQHDHYNHKGKNLEEEEQEDDVIMDHNEEQRIQIDAGKDNQDVVNDKDKEQLIINKPKHSKRNSHSASSQSSASSSSSSPSQNLSSSQSQSSSYQPSTSSYNSSQISGNRIDKQKIEGQLKKKKIVKIQPLEGIEGYICLVHDPRRSSAPFGKVMTVDLLGTVVGGYRGWKQNIGEVDEVVASESEIDQIYQSILKKNQKKRKKLEKKIQIQKSKEIKLDKVNEKDKVDVKEKEDEQQQEEQIKEDEKDNSSLTKVKHSKSKTKSKQKDKSKRKNESYSDQASVKSQSVVGPEKPNHKHLNINKQNLGEDESKIKDEILIEKDAHSEIIKKQKEGGEIKIFETMQQKIDQQINGYKPFDNQTNPMRTRPVRYLNVDMRTMKYFTARLMAERRQPVWMGCHMNHYFSKSSAMLDQAGFKFDCIYDVEWSEDEDDEKDDEEEDEEEDGKDNQKQQDKELIKKITYSDPKEIEEQVLSDIHERELKQFDPNAWEKKERRKKDKKNNKKNNKKKKIGQYYQDDKNICGKFGQWTKADRISYGETMMSHAMLFTGENIIEGAGFKQGSGVLNMPYQRSPSANLDVIDSNLIKQQKEYLLYFEENLRKQEIDLNRMQDKHHIGQSEDEKKEFDKKVEICRERMKQYTQQMQLLLHMSSFRLFVMTGTSYLRMAEKMIEIIDENKLIVLPEKIVDKEKESKLEEDNENKKKEDNDQEKKNENVIDKEKEQIRDKDKEKMDRWKLAFDRLIRQKTTESLKTQDTVVVIKADEQDIIEQKDTKRDNKEKETKDDQTKTTLFDEELAQQYSVIKLTNQENIIVDKWRIENSWGDTMENAGFLTMTNMWFDEHVLEIAVPIDILPPELQAEYHQKPYILPPWDPMGTLA